MPDRTFPQRERLKRPADWSALHALKPSAVTRDFLVKLRANALGYHRLGVVASRKVGGAVVRNRARRVVREVYRHAKEGIAHRLGWVDLIVIVRPTRNGGPREFSFVEAERQLGRLWR